MSEKRAMALLFAGTAVLASIAGVVLAAAHASGTVFGLTIGSGAALGGWVAGCVVVHYGKVRRRQKREELILSR
jgi:hypothetical protein